MSSNRKACMKRAKALAQELIGMFAGGELTDEDKDAVMLTLQRAYVACETKNVDFPDEIDEIDFYNDYDGDEN